MRELWVPVDEFPAYLVSNFGRVKNANTGRILRPGQNSKGYLICSLMKNKRRYPQYVHRLVAEAFIGNIGNFDIDHLDNDPTNNHVHNLEIVTRKINNQRMYRRDGRIPVGMKSVRIVETGEEFRSLADCAKTLNRDYQAIGFALRNGTPTAGFHIEEVMP